MAAPRKVTSGVMHIRVRIGSALERLLAQKAEQGVGSTEAMHDIAELFERALNENWGPQPEPPEPHEAVWHHAQVERDDQGRITSYNGVAVKQVIELPETEQRVFHVSDDGLNVREVGEQEVLQLAREQYPSGLVPVGIDDGSDELEHEEATAASGVATDDDLSHLI